MPMAPAAPGLDSMMTLWPHTSASFAPNARAIRSELPPGGYVTISLTGLVGKDCASACPDKRMIPSAKKKRFTFASSLVFYLHVLDDRAELLDLALQDRVLLRGGRADRLRPDLQQPLGDHRVAHRRDR